VVVRPRATAGGLDVHVSVVCHRGPGGTIVCSEQVVIEAGTADWPLVPGSILQLLVEEMPVYLWWRRGELGQDALVVALRDLADCLIVDSARFERPVEGLARLQALAAAPGWDGHAADLCWTRLDPWREAVAAFFDAPRMRDRLDEIRRVTVSAGGGAGHPAPAARYVVGWLASRLGWSPASSPDVWRDGSGKEVAVEWVRDGALAPAELGAVRIETAQFVFNVRRTGAGSACVVATVEAERSSSIPRTIRLPERDEAAWLCEVLQQPGRDALFAAALAAATHWTTR
jgi:glucose-6-phosphate dehydrogenase assembly protein OpcA